MDKSTGRLTTLDSSILRELQDNFPLEEKPYKVIAERLKISPEQLWDSIQGMLDEGIIRRLGASFDSNKLGFSSTLAAVSVGPECVDRAAKIIGLFPEVTHSYLRKDAYNIWFTIIAVNNQRIENILEQIRTALSLERSQVLNLPAKRFFKLAPPHMGTGLDTHFDTRDT
jgi:DNA-binding Lrp family transcriptional regulator